MYYIFTFLLIICVFCFLSCMHLEYAIIILIIIATSRSR